MRSLCILIGALMLASTAQAVNFLEKRFQYAEAYDRALVEQKPLMVVVATDWCAPCRTYKNGVLQRLARDSRFVLAVVNPDHFPRLAGQLRKGSTSIPSTIFYSKPGGRRYKRSMYIGSLSLRSVEGALRTAGTSDD